MTQEWQIDTARVLDIGEENERVEKLRLRIVGGRVDVVTHDDSPTARIEIADVVGPPVRVAWDGRTVRIVQGKDEDKTSVMETIRKTLEGLSKASARVSVSVPTGCEVDLATVGADQLVTGVNATVRAKTVSGTTTISDVRGETDVSTVSGEVEVARITGRLAINAVSGEVTVIDATVPRAKINTVSGAVTLDLLDADTEVKANAVSGDVTVRVPASGYDVVGTSISGAVIIDGQRFARSAGGAKGGETGRLREGDGRLRIRSNSISGDVIVLRSSTGGQLASAGATGGATPQDAAPTHGSGTTPQDSTPTASNPSRPAADDTPGHDWTGGSDDADGGVR